MDNNILSFLKSHQSFKDLINHLKDYKALKSIYDKNIINDNIKSEILRILNSIESKIFMSDHYLKNILKKSIDNVTNEDLINLLIDINKRKEIYTIGNNFFSLRIHGLDQYTNSPLYITYNEIFFIKDYSKHIELSNIERNRVILAIFSLYKFYNLDNSHFNIKYILTKIDLENFWENLAKYLIKEEEFPDICFDYSEITDKSINLLKGFKAISKFKL